MRYRFLAALLAAIAPMSAHAAWSEATTRHFQIYGEGDPNALLQFATKLEKYDFALRSLSGVPARRSRWSVIAPSSLLSMRQIPLRPGHRGD